jgi:hypothetical protein
LWLGGKIHVDDVDINKEACSVFKLYLDGYLIPQLAVGAFFHFVPNMTAEDLSGSASSIEVGMAIRPRFFIEPKTAFIPTIEFGYRNTSIDHYDKSQDGMALNADFELEHAISSKSVMFGSLGFFAQPVGGDGTISYSFAPIFYLNLGFGFGNY